LNDPHLAPQGKTGIIISALARGDFAQKWGTENGRQTARYEALKERVADVLITTAERVFPGLRRRLIFRQVSTPYTLERLTMNTGGSICGWTYDRKTTFRRKGEDGMRDSVATPVANLLQAGHWTYYPGGAPVCIMTGRLAADRIVRQMKRGRN
jgi:phytoene dehydrogenase-like protein